jgi:hypothetical protein
MWDLMDDNVQSCGRVLRRTNQCSNGKTCGNAGDRAGASIARDAADGREGAEDESYVFGNLRACVRECVCLWSGREGGAREPRRRRRSMEALTGNHIEELNLP